MKSLRNSTFSHPPPKNKKKKSDRKISSIKDAGTEGQNVLVAHELGQSALSSFIKIGVCS